MFKSVFSKYMITFLVINIIVILSSTTLVTIMLRQYDSEERYRTLHAVSEGATELIVTDKARDSGYENYYEENSERLDHAMRAMTSNLNHVVILVFNENGYLVLASGSELEIRQFTVDYSTPKSANATRISSQFLRRIDSESKLQGNDKVDGLFNEEHYYCAHELTDAGGNFRGAVISFYVMVSLNENLEFIIRTVAIVSFAMAVAVMVAAFIITKKMVSPLAKMSDAANDFAAGDFNVRAPEEGSEEIMDLARSFNSMADSMQRLEESRRLFLSNVSHDLRTPMTSIKGFVDSILSGAIPEDQVPHYLGVVSSEIQRLSRLVSSLMDITKIEAGEKRFEMRSFDICEMARQIVISSEQRIEDKKLDVIFDAEEDNIDVIGDRDAIYQVMYNLCDNAIKFSRERGLYEIEIKTIERGTKVRFSIYNEGQGISKEDLPFVFERFYKSDRSRGLDKTGVGLGLYISKTIIEQHGGRIRAESEEGKWCRFEFELSRDLSDEEDNDEKDSTNEANVKQGRRKKKQ